MCPLCGNRKIGEVCGWCGWVYETHTSPVEGDYGQERPIYQTESTTPERDAQEGVANENVGPVLGDRWN